MNVGTDGQEHRSRPRRGSAEGAAKSLIKSFPPPPSGDVSPADSSATNPAIHSASACFSHLGSASEHSFKSTLSTAPENRLDQQWEEDWGREVSSTRPSNLEAIENQRNDEKHDLGDDHDMPLQHRSEMFQLSPTPSDDGLPLFRSASPDLGAASPHQSGVGSEVVNYGRESARQLSEEQRLPEVGTATTEEEMIINDIQMIYAGLDMCEKVAIRYDEQFSTMDTVASQDQLEKLTQVHLTLVSEQHDFFRACSDPAAGPSVKSLPDAYMMPTRLWRYGIHDYLEMMRHQLPESLEYMLGFIQDVYKTMASMVSEFPAYEETWLECLGDLSRYRMAAETTDTEDRRLWARIAMTWYNRAADRNPDMGKFQHHLGVMARHDVAQRLFYYTKSLLVQQPFLGTRTSILDILNPFLRNSTAMRRIPPVGPFIAAHAFLFTGDFGDRLYHSVNIFLSHLDQYVTHLNEKFILQGFFISASNIAAIMGYGHEDALLPHEFDVSTGLQSADPKDSSTTAALRWTSPDDLDTVQADLLAYKNSPNMAPTLFYGSYMAYRTMSVLLDRLGDQNIYAACHVYLAFLWCLALTPTGMKHVEAVVPWRKISSFLNSLFRSYIKPGIAEKPEFPVSEETTWVAEDYLIRGHCWSERLYPPSFFDGAPSVDDMRNDELPSRCITRMYRCIWLGVRLSTFNRWITYDAASHKFSTTRFALDLETIAERNDPFASRKSLQRQATQ
ncbi:hypothetical protein BO82DRAFT_207422 [Aspergillus uvarum CBS 121591]|uniref:DNA/RNA-binding domain-containing protein n=1 Tax=Aspergillus uvarum CBS 121591 TaxID=1448315 RepID=A0A319BXT7_9EURO|nr:hypothetical protein BO82DRAFT_207422 [Aspergillus uvarum CBS 121591]PYH76389.1 hypothetical protein BO82DRAFT_207422 [Aspergillus uvarum CBS 121591]